jgi:hypothetical protein
MAKQLFKPGQSGNPSGRPRGVKDRRAFFRDMVQSNQAQLVQTAVDLALSGNEQMLKLLLDRLLPPRPREEPVSISLIGDNLVEKARSVMQALSDGKITVSEAEVLMRTICLEAKIYENEEIKKQVDELMRVAGKA